MNLHIPNIFDFEDVHVPFMSHHAHLDENDEGTFELNAPVASSNTNLMAATTFATAGELEVDIDVDPFFGRIVNVTSDNAGAFDIYGTDYLNQQIKETVTATVGTVATVNAFKHIHKLVSGAVDGDVSLGSGTKFGLPFVGGAVLRVYVDGAAVTAGTLGAPVLTQPRTAILGDPRGLYVPEAGHVPNGAKVISVKMRFLSGDNVGGLHGFEHFAG